MQIFHLGSILRKLTLLVLLSVAPAMGILLYSGVEQRNQFIALARQDLLLLTGTMAKAQEDISLSTRQMLSTLSLLPEFQSLDIEACGSILRDVLRQNPDHLNIALTDLNGDVLISAMTRSGGANLRDRKHFQEALNNKAFAVGEYIISRVGTDSPTFAYAYPVLAQNGKPLAVLSTSIKLERFSRFHELAALPANSFVAVTDHKGIRLYYYPANEQTNPIGKPISGRAWEKASKTDKPGIFVGTGSDGVRRMFAFQPVRLAPKKKPYLYVWAGIPEKHILAPANTTLTRNLLFMLLATVSALAIAWVVARKTLLAPLHELVSVTQKYAGGDLEARSGHPATPDELGTLTNAFHNMADSLKQSQSTLRNNEARFRLVMDSLDALVYVADMHTYEILFINEYGKKQFGEVTGSICWQSLQKGHNGPCVFCSNKYLLDENGNIGEVYTWEFQNTVTGRWWYIQDRAIKWLDGRIVRIEVATDITKRKQVEEEKTALEMQLRQVHKMDALGTLTGGIAHDFNNILAIILGNAELAKLNIADDQRTTKNIDQILSAANRAKNLIKRLLTFSRQDKGEKDYYLLCHLVEESMKTLSATIPKSVTIKSNISSRCREKKDDYMMIRADHTQFHQLLMNLCVNAVDAMDEKGTLSISVDEVAYNDPIPANRPGVKPGTYKYLAVADTGHGIRPELIDKIFDPFFTTKDVGKGTGIGLSVVQGIIKNHDGHIFIDSAPEKGTTFHIYFPAVRKTMLETKSEESIQIPTGKERILYVDDEKMLAEVGKFMLEKLGYAVTTCTNSTEALELFKSDPNRFDLVITDQAMPNMQGSELAIQMLGVRPDIPIILCTGYSSKIDKDKAGQIGIREFALKPLDKSEIAFLIRKVLG